MKSCVLALGFFDGVHLGHGALLRRTRILADEKHLTAAALTFDTHPDLLVRGERIALLNTSRERIDLMRTLYGIDEVRILHFDRRIMEQSWQSFVRETIYETYQASHVVCGEDFRFGARGEGTPQKLRTECEKYGIGCDCIRQISLDGQTISSTYIRSLVENGEVERASRFLGHRHLLSGTVVSGQQLGRTLGIPTANFTLAEGVLVPKHGVYAAEAIFDEQRRRAVVNIGTRPTVNGQSVTVEPWILDFDGDLYGHEIKIELMDYLRQEKKFPSLDALKAEILRNAQQVRSLPFR